EQNNWETSGLCFNFQQSACSRPPPPITSTFIDLIHCQKQKGHRDFIWKSSLCPLRTLWCNYKSVVAFIIRLGEVGEARVFGLEAEANGAGRAVALLTDDDFGDAL